MASTKLHTVALIAGGIVIGSAGYYFIRPFLVDDVVIEPLLEVEVTEKALPALEEVLLMDMDERKIIQDDFLAQYRENPAQEVTESVDDMMFVAPISETLTDAQVEEIAESNAPLRIAQGSLADHATFHKGKGAVDIYALADGSRVLRLEDFEVTNGPDLHVYLTPGTSESDLGKHIDLGELKGNKGSQNYLIGSDVDLVQYTHVVIYCVPFGVVFSTATITQL